MDDFLASGLQTVVVTTMDDSLGREAIGRTIDRDFVRSLPAGVDPTAKTANTTPSVSTARSSARPFRTASANRSAAPATCGWTTAPCTPTPTGSPTSTRGNATRYSAVCCARAGKRGQQRPLLIILLLRHAILHCARSSYSSILISHSPRTIRSIRATRSMCRSMVCGSVSNRSCDCARSM